MYTYMYTLYMYNVYMHILYIHENNCTCRCIHTVHSYACTCTCTRCSVIVYSEMVSRFHCEDPLGHLSSSAAHHNALSQLLIVIDQASSNEGWRWPRYWGGVVNHNLTQQTNLNQELTVTCTCVYRHMHTVLQINTSTIHCKLLVIPINCFFESRSC